MSICRVRRAQWFVMSLVAIAMLSGCASFSRGVTEAVLDSWNRKEDTRACYIRGRPIEGLQAALDREELAAREGAHTRRVLKVLMVHGIGSHQPGYSTRMAENLARALTLGWVQEKYKEFHLAFPGSSNRELGVIRFSRYLNADDTREMIFAELTWDPIVEQEKQSIAFDNSGEYTFRRTPLNNALKQFVNDTIPDVLMFNGSSRPLIQKAVGQSLCWLMVPSWESLPNGGAPICDSSDPRYRPQIDDEYVFITHSLGSRVTMDALQWIAEAANAAAKNDPVLQATVRHLQDKRFTVFMLSNQLPLLQLGEPPPRVHGQIDDLCGPSAARSRERLFGETHLIAFSDPNDLFSYAIPPRFLDEQVDSRLCPTLTNVILNIGTVSNIFGAEFANPLSAHTGYDNDGRVIGLITKGIGSADVDPEVSLRCFWLEATPEQR